MYLVYNATTDTEMFVNNYKRLSETLKTGEKLPEIMIMFF